MGTNKRYAMQIDHHTKSDRSTRRLQRPPFVLEMVRNRQATLHCEYVFNSAAATLRSPNNSRTHWRAFREAHNYESWIVPKTFRKAFATLLKVEAGIEFASDQLGHAHSAITCKCYVEESHLGPDVRATLQRFAT